MNRHRPGLGIVLMLAAVGSFAALDGAVKWAGAVAPVALILWVRYATQAVLMAAWLAFGAARGGPGFRIGHPRFQFVRGTLLLLTSALSMFGLQYMPVAEFTAIHLLAPVIVTLLAGTWLHERISPLRWALVAGGFVGALIVIRPGSGVFGWAVLFPLAGACCYAVFQVLTRHMATLEHPLTTHFWTGAVGTVLMAPFVAIAPFDLVPTLGAMSAATAATLLLIGLFGTFGHLMLILALGFAPTATLMPFLYTQIAAAALIGWAMFGHLPDAAAWVGMTVIALCGAASMALGLRPLQGVGRAPDERSAPTEPAGTGQSPAWRSTSKSTPTTPSPGS